MGDGGRERQGLGVGGGGLGRKGGGWGVGVGGLGRSGTCCTPGNSACSIRGPMRGWSSKPRCRQTSQAGSTQTRRRTPPRSDLLSPAVLVDHKILDTFS